MRKKSFEAEAPFLNKMKERYSAMYCSLAGKNVNYSKLRAPFGPLIKLQLVFNYSIVCSTFLIKCSAKHVVTSVFPHFWALPTLEKCQLEKHLKIVEKNKCSR